MSRRKATEKNIRKFFQHGSSLAVTMPIELMRELKWREKQKVVIKKRGQSIIISGWKKKAK